MHQVVPVSGYYFWSKVSIFQGFKEQTALLTLKLLFSSLPRAPDTLHSMSFHVFLNIKIHFMSRALIVCGNSKLKRVIH